MVSRCYRSVKVKSNHLSKMNVEASLGRLFSQQEANKTQKQLAQLFDLQGEVWVCESLLLMQFSTRRCGFVMSRSMAVPVGTAQSFCRTDSGAVSNLQNTLAARWRTGYSSAFQSVTFCLSYPWRSGFVHNVGRFV